MAGLTHSAATISNKHWHRSGAGHQPFGLVNAYFVMLLENTIDGEVDASA